MLRELSRVEVSERTTAEEFLKYAPEDKKAELIDGVIIVSPPPLDAHERVQGFLYALLRMFVEISNLGEVRGSRTAVILTDGHIFEPDILFIARDRLDIIEERGVKGAPDLVIEILSASTAERDRGVKFHTYERAGVRDLWLIDPYGPAGTEFYQREETIFKPVMPDASGVVYAQAMPGFKLNTSWLWPAEKFIPVRQALQEMGVD